MGESYSDEDASGAPREAALARELIARRLPKSDAALFELARRMVAVTRRLDAVGATTLGCGVGAGCRAPPGTKFAPGAGGLRESRALAILVLSGGPTAFRVRLAEQRCVAIPVARL